MPRKLSIEEAHEFLDSKPGWIALTTIGPDGYPHTVPLGYFRLGNDILMGVRGNTRKLSEHSGQSQGVSPVGERQYPARHQGPDGPGHSDGAFQRPKRRCATRGRRRDCGECRKGTCPQSRGKMPFTSRRRQCDSGHGTTLPVSYTWEAGPGFRHTETYLTRAGGSDAETGREGSSDQRRGQRAGRSRSQDVCPGRGQGDSRRHTGRTGFAGAGGNQRNRRRVPLRPSGCHQRIGLAERRGGCSIPLRQA